MLGTFLRMFFIKLIAFSLHLHITLTFLYSFIQLGHIRRKLKYFFFLFWRSFVIQQSKSYLNNMLQMMNFESTSMKRFEVT